MNVLFAKISFTLVMGAGHGIENNFKVKLGLEIVRTKIMTFSRLDNSTATRRGDYAPEAYHHTMWVYCSSRNYVL